ncbi:MAG: Gfo/Idh/MocA family oxidoreductase [Bacteroidales bacterium]|nr:Gfo/Idh/MocA family oxidoreductase [Bacteroidales bacterium]
MQTKINIGVIGCASIAERLVIPNFIASGLFNVTHVASRTAEKANSFANKFNCKAIIGYDNLISIEELDAIYIPLPTGMHYEWVKKALVAGKHIFVEKSFTQSFNEAEELINIAIDNDLCIFENFMFPYHSQIKFVKKLIDDNTIGNIKLLRSCFGFPPFNAENNIRYKSNLGGGALLDAGAYTLMAAQLFLGLKQQVICSNLEKEDSDVDFQGSILLKNENNICSQLAFGFDNFYQNNIELWGSTGKITIERAFTAGPGFSPNITIEKQGCKKVQTLPPDNHFMKIMKDFHSCITSGNFNKKFQQLLNQSRLINVVQSNNV